MRIVKCFNSNFLIQIENWKNKGRVCKISCHSFLDEKTNFFYLSKEEVDILTSKRQSSFNNFLTQEASDLTVQSRIHPVTHRINNRYHLVLRRANWYFFKFEFLKYKTIFCLPLDPQIILWFLDSLQKVSESQERFLLAHEVKTRNFGRRTRQGKPNEEPAGSR